MLTTPQSGRSTDNTASLAVYEHRKAVRCKIFFQKHAFSTLTQSKH